MSFFSGIHNFFSKLFGSVPSWSQRASTMLTLVAPLTNTIVMLTAGEEYAAQVVSGVHEVQADLSAAAKLIADSHGSAGETTVEQLQNILGAVTGNLSALLAAGHIKNPEKAQKVSAIVDTITGEVSAILAVLPKTAPKA